MRSRCSGCARCSSWSRAPSRAFAYLKLGLGVLLVGIAAKLVYGELIGENVPTTVTLAAILAVLGAAIAASLWRSRARTLTTTRMSPQEARTADSDDMLAPSLALRQDHSADPD